MTTKPTRDKRTLAERGIHACKHPTHASLWICYQTRPYAHRTAWLGTDGVFGRNQLVCATFATRAEANAAARRAKDFDFRGAL